MSNFNRSIFEKGFDMRDLFLIGLLIMAMNSGCAITHKYGPYMGKVVEKGTGVPIGGVVVFMRFYTEGMFGLSQFEDAVEVLTDKEGIFIVPSQRVFSFPPSPLSGWEKDPLVIIFKPGYGAYPKYPGVDVDIWPWPANQAVTIRLPELKTREERKKNLRNLYYDSTKVPLAKQKIIMKFGDEENVSVGLSPR